MNYQILVNKENKIPTDYFKHVHFVEVECADGQVCKLEQSCYKHFCKMAEDLQKQDILLRINSGYRSIKEQETLFLEGVKTLGLEGAKKQIAEAGCSEHHTGLAIDINIWKDGEKELLQDEEKKDQIRAKKEQEYSIIHQCLKRYGFILRYPKEKEEITGFSYEPWHIRYLGTFAKKIPDDMTLEEYYLEQAKNRG